MTISNLQLCSDLKELKEAKIDRETSNGLTGYPHLDKPWMKFYDGMYIPEEEPQTNMVEVLKERNKWKMDKTAYRYYGRDVSYGEMFHNADLASKVLTQLGVKKGDVILSVVPNIPEEEEIWFGATQIGAICDYVDPRPDSTDIIANSRKLLEIIKYEKPKYIVTIAPCYLGMIMPIETQLKELGINDIVLLNPTDSMDEFGQMSYMIDVLNYERLKKGESLIKNDISIKELGIISNKIAEMRKNEELVNNAIYNSPLRVQHYKNLIKECENTSFENVTDCELINYIGHTSGTSGARPKPIAISNKNAISSVLQCGIVGAGPSDGESGLHILPGFAPFGRFNNDILSYYNKGMNIHVPEFVFSEFGYLLLKDHPNSIMAPPAFLTSLLNCSYLENVDLSFIHKIVYGGDTMTYKDEEALNKWLKKHGSLAEIEKGHGMSEFCGCGTYAKDAYNKPGTIGIPIAKTIYTIVDPDIDDRLVPLRFNEGEERLYGENAVSSDHVTCGKLNGDVIVPHYKMDSDGRNYIRTRDLGYMDKDGCFYIEQRKDRSFARIDGFKIKPYEIEKIIQQNKNVKYVQIVPYYDDDVKGTMVMCHLVLSDDLDDIDEVDVVRDVVYNNILANPTMNSRQIPAKFKIRTAMPINKGGKIDFKALEAEEITGDEINVVINETNIAIESIDIFRTRDKKKIKTLK